MMSELLSSLPSSSSSQETSDSSSIAQLHSTFLKKDVREDYVITQVIGQGSFSTVSECYSKATGEEFAVKSISKSTYQDCAQIENELRILRKTDHENIIKLIDVYETDDYLYLVMELIKSGDLYTEITNLGSFNEMKAFNIFSQLFESIKYLHSVGVIHRDLKLENILISDKRRVKLSDFGLSKLLPSDEEFMKTRCGTPSYVAPEILMGLSYTSAVDIWSLGVVLFIMVFSQYPFQGTSVHAIYEQILTGDVEFPGSITRDLQNLIRSMLTINVSERITLAGITTHPWMRKFAVTTQPIKSNILCRSAEMLQINGATYVNTI